MFERGEYRIYFTNEMIDMEQHMMEQMNTVKLLLVLQIQVFLIQPKNIMEKYIQMRMERMKQRIIKMEQHIM